MKTYLNEKLCAKCGGQCCKVCPGALSPEDLTKPLKAALIALFKTGKYAIDWYEAEEQGYYIRAAVKDNNNLFDPTWGGECVFLTDSGCELSLENRPYQCRMVEPVPDPKNCISHSGSKYNISELWAPYIPIILEAAEAVNMKET